MKQRYAERMLGIWKYPRRDAFVAISVARDGVGLFGVIRRVHMIADPYGRHGRPFEWSDIGRPWMPLPFRPPPQWVAPFALAWRHRSTGIEAFVDQYLYSHFEPPDLVYESSRRRRAVNLQIGWNVSVVIPCFEA